MRLKSTILWFFCKCDLKIFFKFHKKFDKNQEILYYVSGKPQTLYKNLHKNSLSQTLKRGNWTTPLINFQLTRIKIDYEPNKQINSSL